MSSPSTPLRVSLPPSPEIVSASGVPLSESSPSVPLIIAILASPAHKATPAFTGVSSGNEQDCSVAVNAWDQRPTDAPYTYERTEPPHATQRLAHRSAMARTK